MFCDLTGKKILITGASSGIGEATAKMIAARGGVPYLLGRNVERLNAVKAAIIDAGGVVGGVVPSDLAQQDGREAFMASLGADTFAGVVFSAGISKPMPLHLINESYIDETFNTNVKSIFLILANLIKKRKLENSASVVFLSSIASVTGTKGTFAYSASKGALVGSLRALTDEFSKKLIRVNAVAPAVVRTGIWTEEQELYLKQQEDSYPLGLAGADDIAAIISFLLSDQSKLIVGQNFVVDSGCTYIK
jgi:NAD(P)-dependent dehydrogenase (short-subunit alcohol dehydrogenase family)